MKEVIIKNEFDHSYLFVNENEPENNYVLKMLTQNKIPGLLECKLRCIEEKSYCAYDITAKRSLVQKFAERKMLFSDLMELFYELHKIISCANEYLLSQEGFWMEPQYIFSDLDTEELACLYFPCSEICKEGKREKYRKLADFLLDKIDHKDEHAVNTAYHFYKISKEEFFSFESFIGFMEKEALLVQAKERQNKLNTDKEIMMSSNYEQKALSEDSGIFIEETQRDMEKEKPKWWISGILFCMGAILIICCLTIPFVEDYAPFILLPGMTSIAMAIVLIIHNLILMFKESKEEVYTESLPPVSVDEYFDNTLDDVTVFFDQEEYFHLKWKEGRFSKEYILEEFPVTVGKLKESVQVEVNDPSISRLHARFRKQANTIYLQDLDSTNGTFVNGKRLCMGEEAIIGRGDEIQFGKIIVNVV